MVGEERVTRDVGVAPPRTPTFLIVGAQKAGTTALYEYLRRRPDVFMSPVKEPAYFCRDFDPDLFVPEVRAHVPAYETDIERYFENPQRKMPFCFVRDWDAYLRLFSGAADVSAVGEACTWNLASRAAPEEIKLRLPEARVVMILRNPIERAFSAYQMLWRWGRLRVSFRRAVERELSEGDGGFGRHYGLVQFGKYSDGVARYLRAQSPARVRVYLHDDFHRDARTVMGSILEFIGARAGQSIDVTGEFNRSVSPRARAVHSALAAFQATFGGTWIPRRGRGRLARLYWTSHRQDMSVHDRAFLRTVFSEDVDDLSRLLGRDLTTWLS